jgi:D-arabinose 1-dehydrogenase-like Zn-dependent alcohol dehydrogenase
MAGVPADETTALAEEMAMKAAVLEAFREPLVVREVPDPAPAAHGAVVRVEANGVCRSDWHGWIGDWDWIGLRFEYPQIGRASCRERV